MAPQVRYLPRGFPLQWGTVTAHLSSFGRRAQLGVFRLLVNPSNSTPMRRCAAKTPVRLAGHCHHFGQHTLRYPNFSAPYAVYIICIYGKRAHKLVHGF